MEGCGPPNKKKHTFCVHASSSHLLRGPKTQEGTERRRRRTKQAPRPSSSLFLRFPQAQGAEGGGCKGLVPPHRHSPLLPPGAGCHEGGGRRKDAGPPHDQKSLFGNPHPSSASPRRRRSEHQFACPPRPPTAGGKEEGGGMIHCGTALRTDF